MLRHFNHEFTDDIEKFQTGSGAHPAACTMGT